MNTLPKNYPDYLFEGNALSWIRNEALAWCHGKGIDVGGGNWSLPGAIPIDLDTEFQVDDFAEQQLDFVFSSHTLEHIANWQQALDEWISKLKIGGILFLYLPHEEGPWRNCKKHKWIPRAFDIVLVLEHLRCRAIHFTDKPDSYCSFYIVAKRTG